MFEVVDVAHAMGWVWASYYMVSHRSPWGLWTTEKKEWYNKTQAEIGAGFSAPFYGTIWLFTHLIMAAIGFIFVRQYIAQNEGISIAVVVLLNCAMATEKMWIALFFDYRNFLGALVLAALTAGFMIPVLVLVAITGANAADPAPAWVVLGLSVLMLIWFLSNLVITAEWYKVLGVSPRAARAIPVKQAVERPTTKWQ